MAQIVQPDRWQPKRMYRFGEATGEPLRMQHRPVDMTERQVVVFPTCTY
jgi:hypothetical protein